MFHQVFLGDEVQALPGHLMHYPLAVSVTGEVTSMPGCLNVPDTTASIKGVSSAMPNLLTT